MRNKFFELSGYAFIFAFALIPLVALSAWSDAGNVNANVGQKAVRLLSLQFGGSANNFTTSDPSPAGAALTESSATGLTNSNGTVTVSLTNGFTAPVILTAYYWVKDVVTPANSCWVRLGANNTQYQISVDSNYATAVFAMPPRAPFIIKSSAAVTGNVYVDAGMDGLNINSPAGYP